MEGRAMCPVPSCRLGTMEFKRLFTCLEHTQGIELLAPAGTSYSTRLGPLLSS